MRAFWGSQKLGNPKAPGKWRVSIWVIPSSSFCFPLKTHSERRRLQKPDRTKIQTWPSGKAANRSQALRKKRREAMIRRTPKTRASSPLMAMRPRGPTSASVHRGLGRKFVCAFSDRSVPPAIIPLAAKEVFQSCPVSFHNLGWQMGCADWSRKWASTGFIHPRSGRLLELRQPPSGLSRTKKRRRRRRRRRKPEPQGWDESRRAKPHASFVYIQINTGSRSVARTEGGTDSNKNKDAHPLTIGGGP